MNAIECPREPEVVRAVLARDWPERVDPELRHHVDSCAGCGPVALVALLFADARDEAGHDAQIPVAGQIWWRAALRAHADAAHAAGRPILWLQGIAGACAAGIGAALITLAWPSIRESAAALMAFAYSVEWNVRTIDLSAVAPLVERLQPALVVAIAAAACVVLTPIVVYYALSDD